MRREPTTQPASSPGCLLCQLVAELHAEIDRLHSVEWQRAHGWPCAESLTQICANRRLIEAAAHAHDPPAVQPELPLGGAS